jgi:phosphomannomutase
MAEAARVHFAQTLTGFKWIVRAGDRQPGWRFVFGYEEALGYCAGTMVRDKDGMTAALLFAELVAGLKAEGLSVHDRLDALAAEHGAHVTDQWSVRVAEPEGQARIAEAMRHLRTSPPTRLGPWAVTGVDDLLPGHNLPSTDGLIFHCGDEVRVTVRPSGTEPKLKVYFEVVEPVSDGDVASARARAADKLSALRTAVGSAIAVPTA